MTRSVAEQSVEELGGPRSVLARQKRDHVRLEELMREYEAAPAPDRPRLLHRIVRLVFSHAFAEETVLWPALRRTLDDGDPLTRRVETEHQEVNDLVVRLKRGQEDDVGRAELVARTFALLRQDVRDEEDLLLPRLQDAVSGRRLVGLGYLWEAVRRTAPTRPHPAVGRRPPDNVVRGVPLALFDRGRDAVAALSR